MSKFVRLTRPENKKKMIKVYVDDNDKKGTWYSCSNAVYDYVSKNFKEGDKVTLQTDNDTVVKVTKGEGVVQEAKTTPKYVCEDCGKELKDGKYKKCYNCNKKAPKTSTENKSYGYKSPEVQESIRKQAVGHMVSRSLIALQGQVDINAIHEVIKALYVTYDNLTK